MFSASRDDSLLYLLDQCSSIEPSPPVCTPGPKSVLSSTPDSVKASNVQPTLSQCTPSPIVVHSSTSNSTEPSQSITPTTSALKIITSIQHAQSAKPYFAKKNQEAVPQLWKRGCLTTCPSQIGSPSELRKPFLVTTFFLWGDNSFLTWDRFIMLWANTHSRVITREWLLQSVTNFRTWEIPIHQATGYVF